MMKFSLEIVKRISRVKQIFFVLCFAQILMGSGVSAQEPIQNYSRLIEWIQMEDHLTPLFVFDEYGDEYDAEVHRANLDYFEENPALLKKIKKDLDTGTVRWRLEKIRHRFVFVPEQRKEYAALFESYCRDLIDYILKETGYDNPYQRIQTLNVERPELDEEGIIVFLVHNLAKEYKARYAFYNKGSKKVRIKLNGTTFSGRVGSYTSNISLTDIGSFEFEQEPFTIWQNSAQNPFAVLMVPAEETLHILLRDLTESAIRKQIETEGKSDLSDIQKLASDWIAIEEAIVGSITYNLLPRFLEAHIDNLPPLLMEKDLESRKHFKQYRYLSMAIELVNRMGYRKVLTIYREEPSRVKAILINNSTEG